MPDEPKGEVSIKRGRGRPPSGRRKPDEALMVACNWEWKSELSKFADSEGLSLSDLIALAVAELAKKRKRAPMPVRISSPTSLDRSTNKG